MEEPIHTEQAERLRNKRQHFAAPGGSHDKLVGFLARFLPMAVGVVAALMIITPLSPGGEVSFLLDRNSVAMIEERMNVENAMYRGEDDKGRPFSLTAGEAVQRSSEEGIVRMEDLVARIALPDGPARIGAKSGSYNIRREMVAIDGPVKLMAADGYRMETEGVSVDLNARSMNGTDGVAGQIPAGTFSADAIKVDMSERSLKLQGNARLTMIPGKLRMP